MKRTIILTNFDNDSFILIGPEVLKLEYSLNFKKKRNGWLLADLFPQACVGKQPNIAL